MKNLTVRICALSALAVGTWISGCSAGPGGGGDGDGGGTNGDGDSGDDGDLCLPGTDCGGDGDGDLSAPPAADCGNGAVDPEREACDDGNNDDGDGCWGNCLGVEAGYICRDPGQLCVPIARCGDGGVIFPEQCDDGNSEPGDGCSATCKVEVGWKCEAGVCTPTTCGDGVVEGAEMCEIEQEGCTAQCQFAPDCGDGTGPCTSECGDGLVLGEACDDGNRQNGDGCDESCQVEPGYECAVDEGDCEKGATGECILRVPVTFRDFSQTHSDFQPTCGGDSVIPGLVANDLVGGKPAPGTADACTSNLSQWYTDVPGTNVTHLSELVLYNDGSGNFVNRYGAAGEQWTAEFNWGGCEDGGMDGPPGPRCFYDGNPLFFPVDGIPGAMDDGGFEAQTSPAYGTNWLNESAIPWHTNTGPHNFHFTSEVQYWFPYNADTNATLNFDGDDDVWVFINGKLALDMGGLHSSLEDSFTVSGTSPTLVGGTGAAHGMEVGNVYEVKVFHAERKTLGSTFKLTLSGFNSRRSDCTAICGDGVIGFGEECDDGPANGMGYNECGTDCRLGAFCGDGIQQENEACDDADPNAPAGCSGCNIIVVR